MKFGNDKYPKWTDKEEITLIFLAAVNFPQWSAEDLRFEINVIFSNDRTVASITEKLEKNSRAINSLSNLLACNPHMVAEFWKREGVVDNLLEAESVSFSPDGIKETVVPERTQEKAAQVAPERTSEALPLNVARVTSDMLHVDVRLDGEMSTSHLRSVLKAFQNC